MDGPSHHHDANSQSKLPVSSSEPPLVEQHDFAPGAEIPRARLDSGPSSPTPVQPRIDTSSAVFDSSTPPNRVQTPSVQSSWSAASDCQLGHGSQTDPSDRVFPIRSVISVNPASRSSTEQDYFPRRSADGSELGGFRPSHIRHDTEVLGGRYGGPRSDSWASPPVAMSPPPFNTQEKRRRHNTTTGARSSVQADADRQGSQPLPIFANEAASDGEESDATGGVRSEYASSTGRDSAGFNDSALENLTTTRFKHVVTDEGHLVITGRDGTLQRCEDEPIHTPGAVQGFGLLLAIREELDGRFTVRYASENSRRIIGYTPLELFRLSNFTDILTEEQADNLLDHIDFIRDEDADPAINGPEVFSMSIRPPKKR